MTKRQLRELIRNAIKEYMGTGSSGGNAGDGNVWAGDHLLMMNQKWNIITIKM